MPEVNSWRPVHSRGLFEGVVSPKASFADLHLIFKAQANSASFLKLALNFRPRAVTTFRMVSKLGLRTPDKPLVSVQGLDIAFDQAGYTTRSDHTAPGRR